MTWAQRLSLAAILGLGVIITIFSVVRIILTNASGRQPEISWLALWSSIESSVAVMVACLASFKVLLTNRRRATEPYADLSGRQYYGKAGSNTSKSGTGKKFAGDDRPGVIVSTHRAPREEDETELRPMRTQSGQDWRDIIVTRTVTVAGGNDAGLESGLDKGGRREAWSNEGQRGRRRDGDSESQEQILH
jgi:hypothetical protein